MKLLCLVSWAALLGLTHKVIPKLIVDNMHAGSRFFFNIHNHSLRTPRPTKAMRALRPLSIHITLMPGISRRSNKHTKHNASQDRKRERPATKPARVFSPPPVKRDRE